MAQMPSRLTIVGDLERPDHYHLPSTAVCYFWGEYTPYEYTGGLKWNFSDTNRLISNFKKKIDRRPYPDWQYKQTAIQQIAKRFSKFWKWNDLHNVHNVMLVPIPPSKPRHDLNYDSRMNDVLLGVSFNTQLNLDVRDCLCFSGIHAASHVAAARPTPFELYEDIEFDESTGRPEVMPGLIMLFDDLLTTGAHFTAASQKLNDYFPNIPIVGCFIARRIIPNPFAESIDFDVITDNL